jgi:hypothetical protein
MHRAIGSMLALAAAAAAPLAGSGPGAGVHFTSRATVVDRAAMKAASKARKAEATRKAKELEKAYSAQYGKDDDKWPREKRAEVSALRRAAADEEGGDIEADYAGAPPEKLADSARDLSRGAGGASRGLLRVAPSADQADLVVEVTGRHSSKSEFGMAFDDQFGFVLRLGAGGKLAPGRLCGAATRWPDDEESDPVVVNELHACSVEEPYWLLQFQGGSTWRDLASRTDAILAEFVQANGSLFSGK